MKTPNIIVIMADQLKASALRLYGNEACPTPALERLARDGVKYENAFTPHPLCVPARVSFWTGRYPHQTGCRRNQTLMPDDTWHPFRVWKERGYHCGLIGKNHCFQQKDYETVFDTWLEMDHSGLADNGWKKGDWCTDPSPLRTMHREADKLLTGPDRHLKFYVPDCKPEAHSTGLAGAQACDFIEQHGDEPFALWVSFPAPHEPYIVPKRYYDLIDPAEVEIPPFNPVELKDAPRRTRFLYRMLNAEGRRDDLKNTVRTYLANILFIDEMVGKILDSLEKEGLREKTLVVFCSDHGDFSGEHNMTVKGGSFYDCLTRVPLVLSLPGTIPEGKTEPGMVNLVDVIPTVFTITDGIAPPAAAGIPLPVCTDTPSRDAVFSEYGAGMELLPAEAEEQVLGKYTGMDAVMATLQWREAEGRRKMIRTGKWKYTCDPMDPADELYDMRNDPLERCNLAGKSEYREIILEMRSRLLEWALHTEDPVPVPLPAPDLHY
ncbi:MAG: sulfatase [Spirochaetia bacterium]